MKILLYTNDINVIGGIETSFYNLAIYLASLGHTVGVRYNTCDPTRLHYFRDSGIDIQREHNEACDILLVGSIWKRPAYIHARLIVQQCHADWSDDFWHGAPQALSMIRKATPEVDMFTGVSSSAAKWVRARTTKPVIVMNNLAPKRHLIANKQHKGLVFAAFTRMTSEKGRANYVTFQHRVEELGVKAKFLVYTNGDAPDGWMKRQPVNDITSELAGIDWVCSLADTESFGYTIAEANAAGVPAVIMRAHSTPEFFGDGNLILDKPDGFDKSDLTPTVPPYRLRAKSERSIKAAINYFEKQLPERCIMLVMRQFKDKQAKVLRRYGETFICSPERRDELLGNRYHIVRSLR